VTALLELEGVTVSRGRREVVRDVSLTVDAGQVVALLGPNGAGKSTLLEAVGGVIPSQGALRRHGRVATVLQSPGLARRSVVGNVDLAQAWWGVPRAERRARSQEALATLRVDHLARRYAGALSGGERRRVHLARGLAVRPDVLLLDEPFAGLDPENHAALVEDSTTAFRREGAATVVVVHDRADAWALADHVVVLLDGRVAGEGSPERLLSDPPTAAVARFLGYDGSLRSGNTVTLTRPRHVAIDAEGDQEATVLRVVRREDGARVRLRLPAGTVWCDVARDGAEPVRLAEGDVVRARILGGVTFRESPEAASP
jgi:ABC-type sulfate/molybdate transport systems ATPase subunit